MPCIRNKTPTNSKYKSCNCRRCRLSCCQEHKSISIKKSVNFYKQLRQKNYQSARLPLYCLQEYKQKRNRHIADIKLKKKLQCDLYRTTQNPKIQIIKKENIVRNLLWILKI